ncbi:hypothetical protein KP79_PYT18831 [Mizuhopecten yessoensis]|uniref:Uncharacterized protein n=2 Tax=Mizuhopecten yessoensis TaxID=6573 RepID=A0A210Q3A1_MIZYE|nr:hypothetical protein KP79_PYT18831 [Mizuhopecten yessoensis]
MNMMSPSLGGDETADQVIVEKILNRLLTDLNDKKLSQDDLVKLTSYSLQILSSRQSFSPEDDDLSELETGEVYETAVADDLVHFTISKIVDEVKSGQVSREELTGLALSAWDMDSQSSTEDGVVDTLIEDTIQHIISDKSFDRTSSVHDFMLDEFIVKTLNEVSNDLKSGNLPMGVISQILQQMSEVVGDIPLEDVDNKSDMFRCLLARVTDDVVSECSDTLYKVVNIIITSYHTYREASTQGLSELVADICGRISTYLSSGEAHDSDVKFEALCGIAIKICPTTMSSQQVCELTSSIANILHIQTNAQNVDVDHIIDLSKRRLSGAGVDTLIRIARVVLESCQNIVNNLQMEENKIEGEQKQIFLEDVSQFVVDILKMVSRSVDRGNFSESDIQEMSELLQHVSRGNSLAPTPVPDKKVLLINTLASILGDVENGRLTEAEMHELGNHLRSCGERLLGPSLSASVEPMTRAASFTSTAVADNVVSHVLSSIQTDIDKDLMNTESLKELAVCILKTRMSKDKLDTDSDECLVNAVNSSHTHPSPCESRLAEDVVFATIDNIFKDLNEGKLYPDKITSLASSMAIGFSKDSERLDHAMDKILDCLREDTIDREEAKRMFVMIIDQYKSNWSTMPQSDDVSALSSSSKLAESLIRATLNKINRDVQSGAYTEAELLSLMGSTCEAEGPAAADDVVNLISATIQEILQCIESNTISIEDLSNFLSLFKSQKQKEPEDITMEIAHKKCTEAARDISRHGGRSVFIKDVIKCIANSRKDSKTGPVAVLQSLLQIVDSNILTNFIRVTLQRVLVDIGSTTRNEQPQHQTSFCVRSDVHVQSVTSLIAQNVVRNLMARIDHTLVAQGKLSSDEELLSVRLDSQDFNYIQSLYETEPDMCMSYSSNEIGGLILDTLNNIVSNLRLERSMSQPAEQDAKHVSSDVLHDFVLEKLQGIVENMQDHMALGNEWQPGELVDIETLDSRSKVVSFLDMNDKQATSFVTLVLQDVVHDMSTEVSTAEHQQTSNADEQTSTLTLEVENIVVSTLQDIVDDFTDAERECSQKIRQEIAKRKALDALVQIKRDVMEGKDAFVKDTVLRIMKSSVEPGQNEMENEFIENTMNSVISNIEVDNIKASDLYQENSSTELATGVIKDGVASAVGVASPKSSEVIDGRLDRPSVSLQKMVDMTNKMLKFHEEEKHRCHDNTILGVSSCGIPKLDRSSTLLDIASALSHSIDVTIDSVKEGKMCDDEIVTLATALSQSMLDGGAEHVLSTASVDDSIEDFIIVMLEEKKREIEQNGLDSKSIINITDRILGIQLRDKDGAQRSTSVSSVSSEKIAGFVHSILQNIASSLTQLNTMNDNPAGIVVDELEQSESAETQLSGTGSISKQNINPNAVLPRINKRASSSHIIPTQMDCFTEVGNTSSPVPGKNVQLAKIFQEQRCQKDRRTSCKNNSKTKSIKQNSKQLHQTTTSMKNNGCQSSATARKQIPQASTPPKNKRPSIPSCRVSQTTTPSKCGRQPSKTKVSPVKSTQPSQINASKQTLPVFDKQFQHNSPSAVKVKISRADGKSDHNVTKGHVQERVKPSRGVPTIQSQVKEHKRGANIRPNQKKKESMTPDEKLGRGTGLGEEKTPKLLTFEELFDYKPAALNLVPCTPPVDKRAIPMEVQSICGSHRTKVRVIKDNSDM